MTLLGTRLVPSATVGMPATPAPVLIMMNDQDSFVPSFGSVPRGTTVTWRNDDTGPHAITADPAKSVPGMKMVVPIGAKVFDSGLNPAPARRRLARIAAKPDGIRIDTIRTDYARRTRTFSSSGISFCDNKMDFNGD